MLEVLPARFFLRTRLPPLFEPPRTHSRPSFLHLPQGGEPPDASLPCQIVSLRGIKEMARGHKLRLGYRLCRELLTNRTWTFFVGNVGKLSIPVATGWATSFRPYFGLPSMSRHSLRWTFSGRLAAILLLVSAIQPSRKMADQPSPHSQSR